MRRSARDPRLLITLCALLVLAGTAVVVALRTRTESPPSSGTALPTAFTALWDAAVLPVDRGADRTTDPFLLSAAHTVTPAADRVGVEVRDTATGRLISRITEPDGPPARTVGIVGDVVLVRWDEAAVVPDDGDPDRVAGYELNTGRRLWLQPTVSLRVANSSATSLLVAGGGAVIEDDQRNFAGLDARTGEVTWRRPAEPGCTVSRPAATEHLLLFRECRKAIDIAAIDAGTGKEAWHAAAGTWDDEMTAFAGNLIVAGSHVLAESSGRLDILDRDGRTVLTRSGTAGQPVCGACGLAETDSGLVISYRRTGDEAAQQTVVETVTVEGQPVRSEPVNSQVLSGSYGANLVFLSPPIDLNGWPAPTLIDVLEPSTGRRATLPIPVKGEVQAVGSGRVMLTYPTAEGSRVAMFASSTAPRDHPALAGVDPTRWPDACSLIDPQDATILGGRYLSRPRQPELALGATFARPVMCDLVREDGSDPAIRVTVLWVSPDDQAAERLMTSLTGADQGVGKPLRRLSRDVYLLPASGLNQLYDTALMRFAASIVMVQAAESEELIQAIAPHVMKRLATVAPKPARS